MKPLLDVLHGQAVSPPPLWLMRQAGRYLPEYRRVRASAPSFLDLCFNAERAAEVTLQPVRRFGVDAAIIFSDILTIPHALGQPVRFEANEGPRLDPIRTPSDLGRLDPELSVDRLTAVYDAIALTRRSLSPETTLIGFAGAPWTLAAYMVEGSGSRDFLQTRLMAYRDPALFQSLVERLIDAVVTHLAAQVTAGAETVQLFDTWAGLLPAAAFHRWVIEPTRQIVTRLRGQGVTIPIIGFPRGAGVLYQDYACGTGLDAVSFDAAVPLTWARGAVRAGQAIQGNLDPIALVAGGMTLVGAVRTIRAATAGRASIFNLGHGILPETPPEHVAELVALVRAADGMDVPE